MLLAGALAALVTIVIAWPVVRHPSHMVYGHEIVGRHPDVHQVIAQFAGERPPEAFPQPLTDGPGRLLARAVGPVAALNAIVLLAFPLTAMATYAFVRYLYDSHAAALIAALAFSFTPAHLAQAAYHPHFSQTQWLPLFLLALVAIVDRLSVRRAAFVVVASLGLVLSNAEAGFIGFLLAPVVVTAFWIVRSDAGHNIKPLVASLLAFLGAAAVTLAVLWLLRPSLFTDAWPALPVEDIGAFRARWWAYFTPTVDHPILKSWGSGVFGRRGINFELVEVQLYTGYAFLALALIAVGAGLTWRGDRRFLVALAAVGIAAAVISIGPGGGSCGPESMAPACVLYRVAPFFRAYARFGLVVHLVVAVAAGIGATVLARTAAMGKGLAVLLVLAGVFEFWPLPARAHDVLPTTAHRRLSSAPPGSRILDCYPTNQADALVPWLMGQQMTFLDPTMSTCGGPQIGGALAAQHYTHVIVRGGAASSKLMTPLPSGISLEEELPDSSIYTVASALPAIVTVAATGFYDFEHSEDDWWRWMSPQGQWKVRNTTAEPHSATLAVDLVSIGGPRRLRISLDGAPAGELQLDTTRRAHMLGPWLLSPGDHSLTFAADGDGIRPSDVADNLRDRRSLAVAFRNERWTVDR